MEMIQGIGFLLLTLAAFTLFSFKAPKGSEAMSGMANAAIASFLVEAIHSYITGDTMGLLFFKQVGAAAGGVGGLAAAIAVPLAMGSDPVLAVVAGCAMGGVSMLPEFGAEAVPALGILPGFVAGYFVGLISPIIMKKLPEGVNVIAGAIIIAPLARIIGIAADPIVSTLLANIGQAIEASTNQSPLVMGFLLGGIIKIVCTAPLSSMALTAMLGLTGLPMGIAAIACVGGSFTNGMILNRLKLGDRSNCIAIMLEPLTQAPIVTANPIPIYGSNFFGGGIAGLGAAALGIINNAPGTASPIPGLLVPFAFNPASKVLIALVIAAIGGTLAGFVGAKVFKNFPCHRFHDGKEITDPEVLAQIKASLK
ncbi:MAG: PTS sugar transporter subunit IIC [Eubacteriales bacterium]|nr:PTS sugar transporter subunit IIC [Eubacteriales bacterium]